MPKVRFHHLVIALSSVSICESFSQSSVVNFHNDPSALFRTVADRLVYADFVGGTPLAGTNWVAQLYYGSNACTLTSLTNRPVPFRRAEISRHGTWSGGTRTLLGFSRGDPVTLQVRVWDGSQFASFEQALALGGVFGASAPFLFIDRLSNPPQPSDILMEEFRAFALNSQLHNQQPTFSGGPSLTVRADASPQAFANWATLISQGTPNEGNQTVNFFVSNDAPHIFTVQPAISPNGILTFTPDSSASGRATVVVLLRDSGGTAGGGCDTSVPYTFTIEVLPANRPPLAQSQNVSTDEDQPLTIVPVATDPDGDPISFSLASTRTLHGNLTQNGAFFNYTPDADFFGNDEFVFSASDGRASSSATISITVRPVNDLPVPRITVSPLFSLADNFTNLMILSANGSNAPVTLDASESSDIETAALQFTWLTGEPSVLLSIVPVTTNSFEVKSHTVTLVLGDSETNVTATVTFEVITPTDAVNMLILMLDESALDRRKKRPLLASLKTAAASFELGEFEPALNQLKSFLRKLEAQLSQSDPLLAEQLGNAAMGLIEALPQQ